MAMAVEGVEGRSMEGTGGSGSGGGERCHMAVFDCGGSSEGSCQR